MRLTLWFWILCGCASLTLSSACFARPEYAIRHRINTCTACHLSPVGGGIRNVYGKHYGARDYQQGLYSNQDLVSGDLRMLYFYSQKVTSTSDGAGIMAGNIGVNVPIVLGTHDIPETRIVLTENVGGFPGGAGGPRETYARWKFKEDAAQTMYPKYLLLGRIESPFGIITDEHRTYTKIQTKTSWNDMEMGALVSGDLLESVHYDFELVNGEETQGAVLGKSNATLFGTILNLRWMPARLPFALGASGSFHERKKSDPSTTTTGSNPEASAFYTMLSLDRLTKSLLTGSLMLEYVLAHNTNEQISSGFFTDPSYQASVLDAQSEGWYGQLNYDLSRRWTLIYKFDYLVLNTSFRSDAYIRHGLGVRYMMGPNMMVQGRYEKAAARQPTEAAGTGLGAQDAAWALLMISI